jgi:uncharacterized protein
MYLGIIETFTIYDVLIGMGLNSISVSLISYLLRFLIASVSIFVIIFFIFYQKPRSFTEYTKELGLVKGYSLIKSLSCGIISFLIFIGVAIGFAWLLGIFPENIFVFFEAPGDGKAGWLLLIAAINPGFFEEIGFRGVMYSTLKRKYSGRGVNIITAILFGVFHFGNLVSGDDPITVLFLVLMGSMFGLTWGYMRQKSNSVIPSMIIHYCIDALSEGLLNPNVSNEMQMLLFFMGVTFIYPILSILATKLLYLPNNRKIRIEREK